MTFLKLIYRSFAYFWKSHLAVIVGVAISTMVLTGTMIVGDSMNFSLEKTAEYRLGKIEYLFSGNDRYFRSELANELRNTLEVDVAALLQLDGIASAQGGKYKLNNIQVLGIDAYFSSFIPKKSSVAPPKDNEAFISENLSQRLQLKTGDSFMLRIEKASQVPKNAPFVSSTENYISLRLNVAKILSSDELGRFNLNISQTAPLNVFISNSFLNKRMDWEGKANKLLVSGNQDKIQKAIEANWKVEDMALTVNTVNNGTHLEIRSERVFIDSGTVRKIKQYAPEANEILTYMANAITKNERSTPYSFISAGPFSQQPAGENELLINSWIAEDLGASVGDSVEVSYFSIGPLRKLIEKSHWFIINKVVPIKGIYAEKDLMPNLPGLSDAGSCREWEAGVPISLDIIRDKDEDYWDKYRGTPKAFISYATGKSLWENRFGVCTAIRLPGKELTQGDIESTLADIFTPEDFGFSLKPIKAAGLTAARGGVDFSELFMSLSFFLFVAGLILLALLFNLHLDKRLTEIGTLKALGISFKTIRQLVYVEGLLVAIPGVFLGTLFGILYNKAIFSALNTVWYDAVRTSVLQELIQVNTLITGLGIALLIVWITLWFNIRKTLKKQSSSLQRELRIKAGRKVNKWLQIGFWISGVLAIGLLINELAFGDALNPATFFSVGGLLLIAMILFTALLMNGKTTGEKLTSRSLVLKNLSRNRSRSLRIIILFSLGTFVTISTGLNRKDLHKSAELLHSGTGGFLYYMETTLPILNDLNTPETLLELDIESPLKFIQLRKNEGDDASCLNLNRVTAPRILGLKSEDLNSRFTFIKSTTDLDLEHPWNSLKTTLPDDVIPAIADQTVIQWGLGKKVGDTLIYKDELGHEMKLKLIGGLANSIFQGNVLIDQKHFLEHFPSSSGSNVFLIEGSFAEKEEISSSLQRAFRNDGLDLEYTADRLAMFNQIENTYLSIFLLLGGLAMILGTVGLGISLARNMLDRRQEIGILRAIGYKQNKVFAMVTLEHLLLLIIGTASGAIAAFVATIPSIYSDFIEASWQTALWIVLLILINGFIWISVITKNFLHKNLLATLRSE